MFWNNLVAICNQHSTTPTALVNELGIAGGSVTRWKNGSVPRDTTLKKIADHFGVTTDYLLTGEETTPVVTPTNPDYNLTPQEQAVILRFRSCPSLQAAVIKLLDAPESPDELIPVYVAAKSDDEQPHRVEYLTKEEVERIKNAKPVDFDF